MTGRLSNFDRLPADIVNYVLLGYFHIEEAVKISLLSKNTRQKIKDDGYLSHIKYYLTKNDRVHQIIRKKGYLRTLKDHILVRDVEYRLVNAADNGYEVYIDQLIVERISTEVLQKAFSLAARNRYMNIVLLMLDKYPILSTECMDMHYRAIINKSVDLGHLEVLRFFVDKANKHNFRYSLTAKAAVYSGNLEILEYVITELGRTDHRQDLSIIEMALSQGNPDMIEFLCQHDCKLHKSLLTSWKDKNTRNILKKYIKIDVEDEWRSTSCQAKTKKNVQCKNRRAKQSEYCSRHQNYEKD